MMDLLSGLLFAALIPLAYPQAECGCDELGAVDNTCNSVTGECSCKPGVGGILCDNCLPGYTELSAQGCSRQCPPRVSGEQCDTCSFGYRDFSEGCTPCPACFDRVALLFNVTTQLYTQLLEQLNSTLEGVAGGGVNPMLLARVEEYRRMLEQLLERAINASLREDELSAKQATLALNASSLGDMLADFLSNLATAESAFLELEGRLNGSVSALEDLRVGVAVLERRLRLELRLLLEEARILTQNLTLLSERLVAVVSESEDLSLELHSASLLLLERATLTLQEARTTLQRLRSTLALQERVAATLDDIDARLLSLERLSDELLTSLDNATAEVPTALSESERALAALLNISLEGVAASREREVAALEDDVTSTRTLLNTVARFKDAVWSNFTELNATGTVLILRSRRLNMEAVILLERSRAAYSRASDSVTRGNIVIRDAEMILSKLRMLFSEGSDLSMGLEEVLRNIEEAERLSLMADEEAQEVSQTVQGVAATLNETLSLLEVVSQTLDQTMQISNEVNSRAEQILSNATSLNDSAGELAEEVGAASSQVDVLERAVMEDKDAIAAASSVANQTIILAEDLQGRLAQINVMIANLMTELNETELLSSVRLQEVNDTLTFLQAFEVDNQKQVDALNDEVKRLLRSQSELEAKYVELRQHRDLLQEILSNVESLDCREQFQTF